MRRRLAAEALLNFVLQIFSAVAFGLVSARADDSACRGIADAMIKNSKTPYHSVGSISFDPNDPVPPGTTISTKPSMSESIFTGMQVFVKLPNGQWKDLHEVIDRLQERVAASTEGFTNCKHLRDEVIRGKRFAIYSGAENTATVSVTTKIWVSVEAGTLARSQTEIAGPTAPDNKIRHQFVSLIYDYLDVKPPANAN